MGTYRAALKAPDRLVVRMATRVGGAGGYQHYLKYQKRGEPMPCAIVLGCPPYVAFMGPQKLPIGVDEFTVAGGLAGEPINVVRARTVDLLVPAESEIVIEGLIDTEYLEPEAPFGESHGHVALEEFNMPMTGDRDHPSQTADHSVLYQPGGAERIERDQARRLRAAVPGAPAQHAGPARRQDASPCTSRSPDCCASSSSRSRRACRAPRSGARLTAPPSSRPIAERSASRSTRIFPPTMPMRCSGRWPTA